MRRHRGRRAFVAGGTLLLATVAMVGLAALPAAPSSTTAVQDVQYLPPGSIAVGGVLGNASATAKFCGIQNQFAQLAAPSYDKPWDDPWGYDVNSSGTRTGFWEGDYANSQDFAFQPTTALSGGTPTNADTITIAEPSPREPYPSNGGGNFPPGPGQQDFVAPFSGTEAGDTTLSNSLYNGQLGNHYEVTVTLPTYDENTVHDIRLDAYDATQPLALGSAPGGATGPTAPPGVDVAAIVNGVSGSTNTNTNTLGSPTIDFSVTVNQGAVSDATTLAATDITNPAAPVGILATTTISYTEGGANPGVCANTQAGVASPYIIYVTQPGGSVLGYFPQQVIAFRSAGVASATLTLPPGASIPAGAVVVVQVLHSVTPTGVGTPTDPAPTNTSGAGPGYPLSDFSVTTSQDPVPGYPTSYPGGAPGLVADASKSMVGLDSPGCQQYPVSVCASELTVPATSSTDPNATSQVDSAVTATATLLDASFNPVPDKTVSVNKPGGHAPNGAVLSAQTPVTGFAGTATYSVDDDCAETVNLQAIDTTDSEVVQGTPSVTFTAGPPITPTETYGSTQCTASRVQSQFLLPGLTSVGADGVQYLTIGVQLGDKFGNADVGNLISLTPVSNTAQAVVEGCVSENTTCAMGPATTNGNGVAWFEVTDQAAESGDLAVTDVTTATIWPETAGDMVPFDFVAPSPSNSRIIGPGSAVALAGEPTALVTVELVPQGLSPFAYSYANKYVRLTANDPAAIIEPAPGTTSDGQGAVLTAPGTYVGHNVWLAQFYVGDPNARLVVFNATDVTDGVALTFPCGIRFKVGGAALTASTSTVVADGSGTSTLTVNVTDPTGAAVANEPVNLTPNPGSFAAVQPSTTGSGTTNAQGQATFTVSDTHPEVVQFTAGLQYTSATAALCPGIVVTTSPDCQVASNPFSVTFIDTPTSVVFGPQTAPVPATGYTQATIALTAFGAKGDVIAGVTLQLNAAAADPHHKSHADVAPLTAVTDANGLAVFYMSDAMYQTLNLSADYCSSACFPVSGSGQVIFSKTEAQASKLTTPGSGTTTVGTPIDVTVKLALGQPLVGHTVTLETGSGTTTVRPLGEGGNAVTGATGKITFAVTDAKAESITVYALDLTTGVLITGSPLALTFNAA